MNIILLKKTILISLLLFASASCGATASREVLAREVVLEMGGYLTANEQLISKLKSTKPSFTKQEIECLSSKLNDQYFLELYTKTYAEFYLESELEIMLEFLNSELGKTITSSYQNNSSFSNIISNIRNAINEDDFDVYKYDITKLSTVLNKEKTNRLFKLQATKIQDKLSRVIKQLYARKKC